MALCLVVYNLGQRQLRMSLKAQKATVKNQLNKPTESPTYIKMDISMFSRYSSFDDPRISTSSEPNEVTLSYLAIFT